MTMSPNKSSTTTKLLETVLKLMIKQEVFVKCPFCNKYIGLFEIYNENCSNCGKVNFNDFIVIKNEIVD